MSAQELWGIVGDPARFSSWHPAVSASPVSDGGSQRRCTLAQGGELREEITEHDDRARRYTYRIVESPLPLKDYVSTLAVTDDEDGSRLIWESEFEAIGAPSEEVEGMIRGLYEAGMKGIAERAAQS